MSSSLCAPRAFARGQTAATIFGTATTTFRSVTRISSTALAAGALLLAISSSALAQDKSPAVEFRVTTGGLVTVGRQSRQVDDARLLAAQVSWLVTPRVAVTGSFSWARSRDLATVDSPKLDVFTSDIGAELRSAELLDGARVSAVAFAGLGAGARSYNYRKIDAPATNNMAGYASVGGKFGIGRISLRLEARDYVTGFKPLIGTGGSDVRNDIVIMGTLGFSRRSAQTR